MKHYIFSFLLLCALSLANSTTAQPPNNAKQTALNKFLNTPGFDTAVVGVVVKDFNGNNIIAHNQHTPLTPASTLKALTTATALEILGADFTYPTYFGTSQDGTQLIVKGTGDPTLGTIYDKHGVKQNQAYQTNFLKDWAEVLYPYFIGKSAPLDILIDDSYFGYQGVARKWIHEDIGNYYGASTYGISIYDNTYELTFNTENTKQAPQITNIPTYVKPLIFNNLLDFNTTGQDNAYATSAPMSNEVTLIGDVPSGRKTFTIKGAIPNPGLVLAQGLEEILKINNIQVSNASTAKDFYLAHRFGNDTITYNTFHVHHSMPLSDICRVVNVVSNNHYTEALLRTIGRTANPNIYSSAFDYGLETVNTFWKSKNLNTSELFMHDGCGLAPSNSVSADFLSSVLVYMQTQSAWAKPYLLSFPKAGKEGTVRNLMKDTKYAGYLHVKSGSIGGVQAFIGYYIHGEKKLAFAVLVNRYNCTRSEVVKAIEGLLSVALE